MGRDGRQRGLPESPGAGPPVRRCAYGGLRNVVPTVLGHGRPGDSAPRPYRGMLNSATVVKPYGERDSRKEMGLELLARLERPARGGPSGLPKTRRGGQHKTISPPRIGRISNRSLAVLQIQSWKYRSWKYKLGLVVPTVTVLCVVEATAGAAEPIRIDPAALSARIARMMACLMRMTSSMASIQVSGLLLASRNPPAPLSYK